MPVGSKWPALLFLAILLIVTFLEIDTIASVYKLCTETAEENRAQRKQSEKRAYIIKCCGKDSCLNPQKRLTSLKSTTRLLKSTNKTSTTVAVSKESIPPSKTTKSAYTTQSEQSPNDDVVTKSTPQPDQAASPQDSQTQAATS